MFAKRSLRIFRASCTSLFFEYGWIAPIMLDGLPVIYRDKSYKNRYLFSEIKILQ